MVFEEMNAFLLNSIQVVIARHPMSFKHNNVHSVKVWESTLKHDLRKR